MADSFLREISRNSTSSLTKRDASSGSGYRRYFLAEGTANDAAVISRITGYTSIWDLDLDSYQVHARCILLDTKTGYRSQFLAVSGVVNL